MGDMWGGRWGLWATVGYRSSLPCGEQGGIVEFEDKPVSFFTVACFLGSAVPSD